MTISPEIIILHTIQSNWLTQFFVITRRNSFISDLAYTASTNPILWLN